MTTVPAGPQITEAVPALRSPRWRRWLAISATDHSGPGVTARARGGGAARLRSWNANRRHAPLHRPWPPGLLRQPIFRRALFPAGHVPDTAAVRDSRKQSHRELIGSSYWASRSPGGIPILPTDLRRYLEMMLRERYPLAKFEVINTSITAINSHAFLPMVKDLVHYQPDLFVIYAGNTEVVGPFGPGTVLTPWDLSLPAIRARIFLNSTRLGQLVGKVSLAPARKTQWRGMEMFLDRQVRADSPQMKPVYENFAANLRDIVAVARRSGAQVLISTVATNLKDCAPFASLHREGLREDELHSWEGLVQRGADLESAGSYAEALKLYLSAADIDPQYAELQFRIARCLWALGDFVGGQGALRARSGSRHASLSRG